MDGLCRIEGTLFLSFLLTPIFTTSQKHTILCARLLFFLLSATEVSDSVANFDFEYFPFIF